MPEETEAASSEGSTPEVAAPEVVESPAEAPADGEVPAVVEAAPAPVAEVAVPAVDEKLIDRAMQLGLTAEEIASLDGAKLDAELQKREAAFDRQLLDRFGPKTPAAPSAEKPVAVAAKATEALAPEEGVFAKTEDGSVQFAKEFMEQFDDTAKKAFGGMEKVLNAQRMALQEMSVAIGKMNEEKTVQAFDGAIAALPEELRKDFGEGSSLKLKEGPQLEARRELLRTMDAVDKTYRNRGTPLSEEDVIRKSVNLLQGDRIRQLEREKIADHLRKRGAAIQPRATQRKAAAPSALKTKAGSYDEWVNDPSVQAVLDKHGVKDEDEEIELPDNLRK